MCCNKCILNKDSYDCRESFTTIQSKVFDILKCEKQYCKIFQKNNSQYSVCGDCPQKYRLEVCNHDAWVLTFLSSGEEFSSETACYSLDTFVQTGNSELLCELFKAASYEIRKELWFRMVEHYQDRLYLLNQIFERDELAPINHDMLDLKRHEYQYSILQNKQI